MSPVSKGYVHSDKRVCSQCQKWRRDSVLYLSSFITIYVCVIAAVLGACMGSFLNCAAWRIVHGESVLKGRSHCDVCGHVLGIKDLFPVVSFLAHKGRCPYCKAKLSWGHVILELISAVVFVAVTLKFDITLDLLQYLLFACIMLVCSFADIEGYIIPNRFIIAGAVIRIIFILISGEIVKNLIAAAIGGVAIPLVLLVIVLIYEKIRGKEAMGGGDIKLLFVTGLFLSSVSGGLNIGWMGNILTLFFACIIGIIFAFVMPRREMPEAEATESVESKDSESEAGSGSEAADFSKPFPWGPSIAIAAFIVLMVGEPLINWYTGLF